MVLPEAGRYATGIIFLDRLERSRNQCMNHFKELIAECDLNILHIRQMPTNNSCLGNTARSAEPHIIQVFLTAQDPTDDFEKNVYLLRKQATHQVPGPHNLRFYICSLSTSTITYKGLFTSFQLFQYYPDLMSPNFKSKLALVHSRFSTNTFPCWERAHPQRMLCHNGEINTLRGNVNRMRSREGVMFSKKYGMSLQKLFPVVEADVSDSGAFDNVMEFIHNTSDRTLYESILMMVPEAWEQDPNMDQKRKDYYRFNSYVMEPWDGPALLAFSDGRYIGAVLDRNGLRPSRFVQTTDGFLYMSSETGVVDIAPEKVVLKGRLKPGRLLLVDTVKKKFFEDSSQKAEIKDEVSNRFPYGEWCRHEIHINDIPLPAAEVNGHASHMMNGHVGSEVAMNGYGSDSDAKNIIVQLLESDRRLISFGYTNEIINLILAPMVANKKEALGSMGNDAPLACLSKFNPPIYDYFKQQFAQVTNPPIDPFREKIVMSARCPIGPMQNLLEPSEEWSKRIVLDQPILTAREVEGIKALTKNDYKTATISIVVEANEYMLKRELDRICAEAAKLVQSGATFLILSDEGVGKEKVPISSLLALGAIHQHLIQKKLRSKTSLIVKTGEAREMHHFCVLIGYGADAVCPYVIFETMNRIKAAIDPNLTSEDIEKNFKYACVVGINKVMAKMGISTLQSYKGAQIFEPLGLSEEVVKKCFTGSPTRLGGCGFKDLANEALSRHSIAYNQFGQFGVVNNIANNPGVYHWRKGGEKHLNEPEAVAALQEAAKLNSRAAYKKYSEITQEMNRYCTIRGQFCLVQPIHGQISIDEVEPAVNIVKRFATGAMSLGSISDEAHKTLAVAMNRVGGKSNSGEGGEIEVRFMDNVDSYKSTRSAIKQVASARFGVTSAYLSHADDLQIKMAQGAKPGEGGELPYYKVTEDIAEARHAIPYVGLISPPPHHDIYSIEDLAQLIYDLKCANPYARVSVKLVSELGVGIVAAGVAKGKADLITISGHDGGTGASSWTGIKHAGLPWEMGLSEAHQVLVRNGLRSRVRVQADGQIRSGLDVVIAGILGADEFGFSTAPLITLGCIMMRKCHLNTCPVGIATQDPELRKKFAGEPEHLLNYLFLLAEEIRQIMSTLGVKKFDDLIGQTKFLGIKQPLTDKARTLDYHSILHRASDDQTEMVGGCVKQEFNLENRLDYQIYKQVLPVIEGHQNRMEVQYEIKNVDRAFGASLSYFISRKYGEAGLPEHFGVDIKLKGSAGQAFGSFLAKGVHLELEGDSNDYVGKGLSGGEIVIFPPKESIFKSDGSIIVGNVCLYGATDGKAFFRGQACERFCVRNSGAIAVCEGCGDHGCEYMTGGIAIILGRPGRNFAAGMSGGFAFVYDEDRVFSSLCNTETVDLEALNLNEDLDLVHGLLKEFKEKTRSVVASEILASWPESCKDFHKVFPKEYKRALRDIEIKRQQEAEKVLEVKSGNGDVKTSPSKEKSSLDIEDIIQNPKLAKKLNKTKGFMLYKRVDKNYRDVKDRMKDFGEIQDHKFVKDTIKYQAARCMDCGVPFCQSESGCPLGNIIPTWNNLVFQGNWKEAYLQLAQTNNFPEFTGRVCPAPCEGACVLGINAPPVNIKNIENTIIETAFEKGFVKPQQIPFRTGHRVAIIGSGPAGLAAAAQLNSAGHWVFVFERNDKAGGLLRYGIPNMKLDKKILDRRIDLMKDEGITFITSTEIGKDVPAKSLMNDYDAVLLTVGATWPRGLNIPGSNANGIHFAMSFLETWQKHQGKGKDDILKLLAANKDVIIIGGGDTGNDCIGTSLRQGAKSITNFEILPESPESRADDNPWPQWPRIFRTDYGHAEVKAKFKNDPRQYCILSKNFTTDENNNLTGVDTVKVKWTKDNSGRFTMSEIPGSEAHFKADMVLLAMGFLGPEKTIASELKLNLDNRGNVKCGGDGPKKYTTSINRVFAAGDCRRGQSLVVWAINEGRQAAREIDIFLMGKTTLPVTGGISM